MTEEPKLYDYYFYVAEGGNTQVSALYKIQSGTGVRETWKELSNFVREDLGASKIMITAFNFIKTGP